MPRFQASFVSTFPCFVAIRWLLRLSAGCIALCFPIAAVDSAHAEGPRLPNVLFIMADQWRADSFGFAGNPDVRTPAFDTFAGQSIRFSNAVSTIPVCSPTRAALPNGPPGTIEWRAYERCSIGPQSCDDLQCSGCRRIRHGLYRQMACRWAFPPGIYPARKTPFLPILASYRVHARLQPVVLLRGR